MQFLDLNKKQIEISHFRKRSASESDFQTLIKESTTVFVEGEKKIVYLTGLTAASFLRLRQEIQQINFEKSTRTSGLVTTSRIFGYAPRNVLRGHPCRSASLAIEQPEKNALLCSIAAEIDSLYKEHFPEIHTRHSKEAEKIELHWKIKDSVFTSGIVNCNNPLQYHFDSGNFSDVCSAMIGFKNKTSGGFLACPEINCGFEISDCSLLFFDGQKMLHGVTPIKKHAPDSYRYTVVFYSLKQMWNCKAVSDEISALRERRTLIEKRKRDASNN